MDFLVNIDVDDIDRGVSFYTAAFGLRVGRRFGGGNGDLGVELLGGPVPIYLLPKRPGTATAPQSNTVRDYDRHWTPIHLDFTVNDIDAATARACAAGATLEAPVSEHRWGRLALLADPFGHGFCFVQFTGRGYDALVEQKHP